MREYLAEYRRKRNESQQNVASALGISRQYYNMIESGERQRRMDMLLITGLANHFGVAVTTIVDHEQRYLRSQENNTTNTDQ